MTFIEDLKRHSSITFFLGWWCGGLMAVFTPLWAKTLMVIVAGLGLYAVDSFFDRRNKAIWEVLDKNART